MPATSVIIPTRDRAGELREALASVAAQDDADFEVIVVDDASGPEVAAVVNGFDGRFRHVPLPRGTHGAPAARNLGVARAAGEFVVFLDSDDLLDPHCLASRRAYLEARPELDFAVWPCRMFRRVPGDLPLLWNDLWRNVAEVGDDLARYLRKDVVWQTASPMWRRPALARVGGWDEACPSGQDWEFHVRAIAAGLRYEKVGDDAAVDHSWRTAGDDRRSIGRDSFEDRRHCTAWAATVLRIAEHLDVHGLLTSERQTQLAALVFRSAVLVDDRVDGREARRIWRAARDRGLVTASRWAVGTSYLIARRRSPALARRIASRLDRHWPRDFFAPDTRAFNTHRPAAAAAPTVSFAIPARDCGAFIEQAVRSCLAQTFRDLEVVVVDDASRDDTGEILDRVARGDGRLRAIHRPAGESRGLVASIIDAVEAGRGEVVARMDGDDVCLPLRIDRQLDALDADPQLVLVGGGAEYVDPYGQHLGVAETPTDHAALDAEHLRGRGGVILHPAATMRRSALDRVGGYRREYDTAEDLDLFLRLAEVGRIANVPETVVKYRLHPKSVTHARRGEQFRRIAELVADARRRRGLPQVDDAELFAWEPEPPEGQLERWGWMALRSRRLVAARGHAMRLLQLRPLSPVAWRLALCAARGR